MTDHHDLASPVRGIGMILAGTLLAACASSPKAGPSRAPGPPPAATTATNALALVPLPVSVRPQEGAAFKVTPATAIVVQAADPKVAFVADFLAGLLTTVGPEGPSVARMPATIPDASIVLSLDLDPRAGDEAYDLEVTSTGVTLKASAPAGLFYAAQTLRQILPRVLEHDAARPRPIVIPPVRITDRPRFAWRGAMLDVARHFFDVADVKRYIDLMALHKLNRLHLHLSDDQGWRIEIRSWPNLTAAGARTEVGGTVGGFYTQDEYKEIVAYAKERFVEVIPEIDMPGHTNAALASYPELNCDGQAPPHYTDIKVGFSSLCVASEVTYRFVEDVVREISSLSPSPYFHVGGDEVKTLSEADYARFIVRVSEIVKRLGKRVVGWDEIAAVNLDPPPLIQHWRPGTGLSNAVARGASLIMSPANRAYLDMQYDKETALGLSWAGRIEVSDAYSWDPAKEMPGVPEAAIVGVEAPLWTETLATIGEVEFLGFPRLAAIAEIGWTPQARREWEDFRVRLGAQGPRWQAMGLNFYRSPQIPWKP
jgi:hexosaminidase